MEQQRRSVNRQSILDTLKNNYSGEARRNITFSLPDRLIKEFKKDCDTHGLKMNQVIQKMIEDYMKEANNH